MYMQDTHTLYLYTVCCIMCSDTMYALYIVFGKTIRRREMLDHSFERKFYGASYRLC